MPVLNIDANLLCHPVTLAYLQSIMLWPNDENENERTEWMCTAIIDLCRQPEIRDSLTPSQVATLLDLATDATPARHLKPEADAIYEKAFFAGELLARAIGEQYETGVVPKLDSLKTSMVEDKRRVLHPVLNFKRSTLDHAIVAPYRSVAHLWGAHAYACLIDSDDTFPCRLERTPHFLSMAAWLANRAIAIPWSRRKIPALIDIERLWTVPSGLELPMIGKPAR